MDKEDGIGLVIFDCDGVLIDSEIISCETIARLLGKYGVPTDTQQIIARYLGRPASAILDDYRQTTGQPPSSEFLAEWRTSLFDAFVRSLTAIPGIRETLEALPVPFCLASSSDGERIDFCLRITGLHPLFEGHAFNTGMVVNGKPAPDLFLYAAGRMDVHPARCLVIEDSPSGIMAARSAGMTAWGFTGGSHYKIMDGTEKLLQAGADRIIRDMKEMRLSF